MQYPEHIHGYAPKVLRQSVLYVLAAVVVLLTQQVALLTRLAAGAGL
tara:strand:+ start:324 stop:464 length:141 start_codon:yes stop_codon:yes gene_type:complete